MLADLKKRLCQAGLLFFAFGWSLSAAAQQKAPSDSRERLMSELKRAMKAVVLFRDSATKQNDSLEALRAKLRGLQDSKSAGSRQKISLLKKRLAVEEGHFDDILVQLDSLTGRLNFVNGQLDSVGKKRVKP